MFLFFSFRRKWMESRNQLVLVGVVTGNPTSRCNGKTFPDVFNFVGNQEVNRKRDEYLILRIIFIHVVKEKKRNIFIL